MEPTSYTLELSPEVAEFLARFLHFLLFHLVGCFLVLFCFRLPGV